MAEPATKSKPVKTETVKQVTDRFDASWKYNQGSHHARWTRNRNMYNNIRTLIGYKGITNTFVPMAYSTVETLTAALGAGRPSIDFLPQDMYKYIMSYYNKGKKPDLKALNALYDYYWDCDNWDLKSIKTIRNGFITGIAAEYLYWDGDKPRIINLSARDLIYDPNLSDPMQLITHPKDYYAGRRYLTSIDALKAEQLVDPADGKLKNRFTRLDQVRPGFISSEQTEKELNETFIGATGSRDKLVEVIEIIDGNNIRSVANRSIEIEDRDNKLGVIPIVIHRFIADEDTIPGKAILDPIWQEQELLNDVTNQSVDAVTEQMLPNYELDPAYSSHLPNLSTAPGTVHPFVPGSLKMVNKNPVSPQAFNERSNMKNEIRETTGADQVVKGVGTEGGKTTATEINAQLNQAGQRFELFILMLEKEGFYQRSKIVYKMILHYVTDKQLVPTNSVDGPKFHAFDPKQFDDSWEPKIKLAASVENTKAKAAAQTQQSFSIVIQDPTNDLWEAKKIMYPKMFDLTEEELDKIIGAQKPAPQMPMGPSAVGGVDPNTGMPGVAGPPPTGPQMAQVAA